MRNLYLKVLLFSFTFGAVANAQQGTIDKTNCREGESVEFCREHKIHEEQMKDPNFAAQFKMDEEKIQKAIEEIVAQREKDSKNGVKPKGTLYRIPVVFHVLHNGGAENISKEQIIDCINVWNRDWRARNADTASVVESFKPLIADCEVEFVLATKAPDGTIFTGITRTQNALTSNGSNGNAQVNAIKAGNDVYQGEWPGNKYLNVFVCQDIGGAAGYTYRPQNGFTSMYNGIWALHNYVGSIGTSSIGSSRTLTHECGHWLDLPHVWGSTNSPGLASNCNTDDGITDTPNTIGVSSCKLNENTCGPLANVENYMDYSYCSKMFTQGQRDRVRAAITTGIGGRNLLVTQGNIDATGADSNFFLAKAVFTSSAKVICVGQTIDFKDESFNKVTGWNWTFSGGSPSTSIEQNPSITYNTPGLYAVTLSATDGTNNASTTINGYIEVLAEGIPLNYSENFENYTSLNDANSFFHVNNNEKNNAFEIFNGAGSSGTKSVRLRNFGQTGTNTDELVTKNFDLSNIPTSDVVTLSFKYAYRKKTSANNESLRVLVSTDCGETFTSRKTLASNSLSSQTSTSEWVPTPADWVQVHVTNVTSAYFVNNLQAMFRFVSDDGNNIYLDDINFYNGDETKLGIGELGSLSNISLYPNPADQEVNVNFNVANAGTVSIEISDLAGKSIKKILVNASAGDNLVMVDTDNLSTGMYLMNVVSGNSSKTMQFAVK